MSKNAKILILILSFILLSLVYLKSTAPESSLPTEQPFPSSEPSSTNGLPEGVIQEEPTLTGSYLEGTPPDNVVAYTIDAFSFGYSQKNITASPGDTVRITLTNSGGNHDFVISELAGARTSVISQGQQDVIEFQIPADATGSYTFFCSVGNHRQLGMEGTLLIQ